MGCCLPIFDCCFWKVHLELGAGPHDEESSVLKLKNGRQLGYLLVGTNVRTADQHIFWHHGHPSSRLDVTAFDLSCFPNTCIIGVDRPGAGLSEQYVGRKVSDHVQDVLELADHLGINKFGVVGYSGGGPYALAARALIPPERLDGVVCISGVGPLDVLTTEGMYQENVDCFANPKKAARKNRLASLFIGSCCCQVTNVPEYALEQMPQPDQDIIRARPSMGETLLKSYKEAFRGNNLDTFVEDCNIYNNFTRWGFQRDDIKGDVPLAILQGDNDKNVPPSHAEWYGEIQNARVFIAKGHGHISLIESAELSKFLQAVFSRELDSYPGFKPAATNGGAYNSKETLYDSAWSSTESEFPSYSTGGANPHEETFRFPYDCII